MQRLPFHMTQLSSLSSFFPLSAWHLSHASWQRQFVFALPARATDESQSPMYNSQKIKLQNARVAKADNFFFTQHAVVKAREAFSSDR